MAGIHAPFLEAGGEHAPFLAGAAPSAGSVGEAALANEAVSTAKIKANAITSALIANEAVAPVDVKPDVKPVASGVENTVVVGTAGVARKVVAAITGNGVATEFVVKHNLETQTPLVTFLTAGFSQPVTMLAVSVASSLSEVKVTFTLAPGAKAVFYVVIVG
jgi:hypothetical protein